VPDATTPPPEKEIRDKLRLIRSSFTKTQRLMADIERVHDKFLALRSSLDDKDNGAKVTLSWVAEQKKQINTVLSEANVSLTKLKTVASSVDTQIANMSDRYATFQEISSKVFNEEGGLQALHDGAIALHRTINKYAVQAKQKLGIAEEYTAKISEKNSDIEAANSRFLESIAKIEDPENGLEAQLRKATEYSQSALMAKTKAESEHLAVKALQNDTVTIVDAIKESSDAVDRFHKESESLTDNIRNTLNLVSIQSLSEALRQRTEDLKTQAIWWGIASLFALLVLIAGVCAIFYALFLHGATTPADISGRLQDGPTFASMISKFLFTTPLVFAVYFTTNNYKHYRDLQDKYAWKETVAKNLQNYVKTLKDEFGDVGYEKARFEFVIQAAQKIYVEPTPTAKRRKYNIGFNKVFNLGLEEEDLRYLEEKIGQGVEELTTSRVSERVSSKPKDINSKSME
jgi:hypothetical protein